MQPFGKIVCCVVLFTTLLATLSFHSNDPLEQSHRRDLQRQHVEDDNDDHLEAILKGMTNYNNANFLEAAAAAALAEGGGDASQPQRATREPVPLPKYKGVCRLPRGDDEEKVRIACVGDSITYGNGYHLNETRDQEGNYPLDLNAIMADRGIDVEIGNFGHRGCTVSSLCEQSCRLTQPFNDSIKFEPHIAVVLLGTNDATPGIWRGPSHFITEYVNLLMHFLEMPNRPIVLVLLPPPPLPNPESLPVRIGKKTIINRRKGAKVTSSKNITVPLPEMLPHWFDVCAAIRTHLAEMVPAEHRDQLYIIDSVATAWLRIAGLKKFVRFASQHAFSSKDLRKFAVGVRILTWDGIHPTRHGSMAIAKEVSNILCGAIPDDAEDVTIPQQVVNQGVVGTGAGKGEKSGNNYMIVDNWKGVEVRKRSSDGNPREKQVVSRKVLRRRIVTAK